MKKTMRRVLFGVLVAGTGLAWGGQISDKVSKVPSDLRTPLGPQSNTVQKFTGIACYDVLSGNLNDCGYDFTITGLVQPDSDVANNGGHTHDEASHPVGDLRVVAPTTGSPGSFLSGQTSNDVVVISHKIPRVSGKIKTELNLRVPPGWQTVSPESCDGTRTSWCFVTTIDVSVPDLSSLPDSASYAKIRSPDTAHTDAVAFSGTSDALIYLGAIADTYKLLSNNLLRINDMSLLRGGVFDLLDDYLPPHGFHRTGQSADINRNQGDCTQNKNLKDAVNAVMPSIPGSFFATRLDPSQGRFLCETKSGNRIHIDFDVSAPPTPSPFQ